MSSLPGQSGGPYSALSLRRRSVWEAADSGVLLWRNNFVYFIPFFAIPVWVAACGLRFVPEDYYYLSYLILWWLKPLFDRLVLHVVSIRFFGSPDSSGHRELRRGLFRTITRFLLGDLLWRRFSPYRSSRMPVRVLERGNRVQFRLRKKALVPGGLNFCFFISAFGLCAEAVLLLGEIAFAAIAARMFFPSSLGYLDDYMKSVEIFIFAAFCFNYILIESLYVCMGFGLYINSRVEVEGWDLQLLFQKFAGAEEQTPASVPPAKTVAVICFILALFFTPASRALYADSVEDTALAEEIPVEFFPEDFPFVGHESVENLKEILASPDFGYEKEGWEIQLKQFEEPEDPPDINLSPWMELLKKISGYMLRLFVILTAVVFLGFSVFWFWKNYRNVFRGRRSFRPRSAEGYVNPLISPKSPESLFTRAASFFDEGNFREAWAACLSGCIAAYTRYHSLSFPPDATEYGCLDLVRVALPDEADRFDALVRTWIFFAYGGRAPAGGAFEGALAYGRSLLETTAPDRRSHEP